MSKKTILEQMAEEIRKLADAARISREEIERAKDKIKEDLKKKKGDK